MAGQKIKISLNRLSSTKAGLHLLIFVSRVPSPLEYSNAKTVSKTIWRMSLVRVNECDQCWGQKNFSSIYSAYIITQCKAFSFPLPCPQKRNANYVLISLIHIYGKPTLYEETWEDRNFKLLKHLGSLTIKYIFNKLLSFNLQ